MVRIILCITFLIAAFSSTSFGQQLGERFDEKWLVYKDCPVSYELVVLSVKHYAGNIFMLTDAKYFNEKDLTSLFSCLSHKYPEFALLNITLFSDRANLDVAIRSYFNPPPHVNPPIDTGKEDCSNLRMAKNPCPLGYYRADYSRFDGREFYDFSEDSNKVPMKRVFLQPPFSKHKL